MHSSINMFQEISVLQKRVHLRLKGHSQLWDRADLDTIFLTLKRVYLKLKSKLRVEYI